MPVARNDARRTATTVAVVFLSGVAVLCALGLVPVAILWLYLGASALSWVVYALDKAAARAGRRRTPENTLHLLALIGGWPGALVAQQWLRHKTAKASFIVVYRVTVVVNVAGLAWLASGHGAWLVESARQLAG